MNSQIALVLEDDPTLAGLLDRVLTTMGYEVGVAHRVADARSFILDRSPVLMVVDIYLPDGNGLDLMAEFSHKTHGRFIVLSGQRSHRSIVRSIRHQAADFLDKPVELDDLRSVITRIAEQPSANDAIAEPTHLDETVSWVELGSSHALRDLRVVVSHASAQSDSNVLIEGEPGTDKYSVARLIHKRSRRSGQCVRVACASGKDGRSSERFFGLEDPETGSVKHIGYLEQAAGGTLILDDVSELDVQMQSQLLSFLQTGRFFRVNGKAEIKVSLGIVSILRQFPPGKTETVSIRQDLYFRLAQYYVKVPNLRQCASDKIPIADYLLANFNRLQKSSRQFTSETVSKIESSSWPGNVLELKNRIEQAVLVGPDESDIEFDSANFQVAPESNEDELSNLVGVSFWEAERRLLLATLKHLHGDKDKAAKMLGISLKTLYNRLNAYS